MKKNIRMTHVLIKHRIAKTERHAQKMLISFSILSMTLSGVLFYKLQTNLNKEVSYNLSSEIIKKLPENIKNKILKNVK